MENRGIYLIVYTGPGQPDNHKKPEWLQVTTGCCKFGKSLDLAGVYKRYNKHLNGNCEIIIAGRFKDRDDIDAIEKSVHKMLDSKRLRNCNNRPSEWMKPIELDELKKIFIKVIMNRFDIPFN